MQNNDSFDLVYSLAQSFTRFTNETLKTGFISHIKARFANKAENHLIEDQQYEIAKSMLDTTIDSLRRAQSVLKSQNLTLYAAVGLWINSIKSVSIIIDDINSMQINPHTQRFFEPKINELEQALDKELFAAQRVTNQLLQMKSKRPLAA